MRLKAIVTAILALTLGAELRAQEILEAPGPYIPLVTDITDVSALITEGKYSEALDSLSLMMAADSLDDALWYYSGICKLDLGRFRDAASDFSRAIELDPSNSSYYEQLYSAYEYIGDSQARSAADSLCVVMGERFPGKFRTPFILTKMADDALAGHKDSLALRYYDEALALDDSYVPALLGKAEAFRLSGNDVGYFSSLVKFARLDNIPPKPKSDYINRYLEIIDGPTYRVWHKQIDEIVDAVAETHPKDSSALVLAGRWFYSTGQKDKGMGYFRQWRDTNPGNFNAESLCISLIMQEGTDKEVIAACDNALKRFSDPKAQVQLLCIKADCLYKTGRKWKSFRTYEKALKIDPEDLMTLNNYAYFLSLERRDLRKAEKMSRKTVEGDPENVSYLDTYGYILYLLKRPADAKPYFKKAIMYGGKEDEAVLRHYALVLEALGEKDLARYYRSLYESKAGK